MKKLLLSMLLCAGLLSCSDDDSGTGSTTTHKLVKTNIEKASYIYGSSAGNMRSAKSGTSDAGFYIVDKSGNRSPIEFFTDNGEKKSQVINNVIDINDQYVLMEGYFQLTYIEVGPGEDPAAIAVNPTILVNKKTEAIYEFPFTIGYYTSPDYFTDRNQNFYFLDHNMVYKVNTSDPDNLQVEEYLPKNQEAETFIVNKDGICVINQNSTGGDCKFKLPGGRIYPAQQFMISGEEFYNVFEGFSNIFYMMTFNSTTSAYSIKKIYLQGEELISENVAEFSAKYKFREGLFVKNKLNDTYIGVFYSGGTEYSLLEFNPATNQINETSLTDFPKFYYLNYHLSSDALYVSDNNKTKKELFKIDLKTNQQYKIDLTSKGYEAYTISTNENSSELSFTGLRYSDGKNIVGTIDSKGDISVFEDTSMSAQITTLIKLN